MLPLLDKFAGHLIVALLVIVSMLSIALAVTLDSLEEKTEQLTTIKAQRDNERARYVRYMHSYDEAIKSIVKYYDTEITQVKDFKRRDNETDCEAANRLLTGFRY